MAHWRCARRPLTSLPVSLTFSLGRSVRLAPSLSVSSFNRSFLPNSPGSSLSLYCSFCVAIPPRRLLPSAPAYPRVVVTTRVNPPTYTRTQAAHRNPIPPSAPSTLCVCPSGFDPARRRSPRPSLPRPPPPEHPSIVPWSVLPSPLSLLTSLSRWVPRSRRLPDDVAACYDLHSSRNKTSTTPLGSAINETVR